MKSKKYFTPLFLFLTFLWVNGQDPAVHSHNDYLQDVPFWKAISAGVLSVESDVFLMGGKLMVAHEKEHIIEDRTLESLYLKPINEFLQLNLIPNKKLQLLIDLKSEAYTTLDAIVKELKKYPTIINNKNISIVISGNRPKVEDYSNYPHFILFDYQDLRPIKNKELLDKIGLISLSFRNFSDWNGLGRLTKHDLVLVDSVVEKAHSFKKPFRFWATPDSKTSWKAMADLGVNFINTDRPFECVQYVNSLSQRVYVNQEKHEPYLPNFENDGSDEVPKNIILMIGDGNGLAQISATALANGGSLSLTQLKNIGFSKTQSADDFTTDSAAGATAMATGTKTANRAIGVDLNGKKVPNVMELLQAKNFTTAIVTTDEISGATPASFFAHQIERSMSEEILHDLETSKLDFFVATGNQDKVSGQEYLGFKIADNLKMLETSETNKMAYFFPKENTVLPIQDAVRSILNKFQKSQTPFFLMVEGAKIDSYGHANKIDGIIDESIAFDKAVSEALRFADDVKNTLVIITADHETGGLTIPQGNVKDKEVEADFTTNDHTGIFVPVFAYGPQSQLFRGVYENTEIHHKILEALGL